MTQRKYRIALSLLCALGVAAAASAAHDSAKSAAGAPQAQASIRTSGYAALPDWFGQWEIVGLTPSATGGFEQSLEDAVQATKRWGPPPYKPEMRAVFDQVGAQFKQASDAALAGTPDPGLRHICTFGYPAVMLTSPLMFEILPTPKETAMIFSGREMRHIYTDGRAHTAKDDLWPTFWGDSIGHWDGATLVIDTIAVSSPYGPGGPGIAVSGGDGTELRLIAILSPDAHFVERIRMTDKDHLEDRMTITDPVMFTAPWHISRQYRRVTHMNRMVHEDCEGEDRNPIVGGRYTISPPPPAAR
ncbi:MAG TPA: hypothetical protein VIY90_18685 [Steroidobacteraceae bacterium]